MLFSLGMLRQVRIVRQVLYPRHPHAHHRRRGRPYKTPAVVTQKEMPQTVDKTSAIV